jgi:hypothetical protein
MRIAYGRDVERLDKATRSALEGYRRGGWTVHAPTLVDDVRRLARWESRDRRLAPLGSPTFMVEMSRPDADFSVRGYGGTPDEAAKDALAQAGQSAG